MHDERTVIRYEILWSEVVNIGDGYWNWREVYDLMVRFDVQRTHFEGLRLTSGEDEEHIIWVQYILYRLYTTIFD
jgi:hypothetical protein